MLNKDHFLAEMKRLAILMDRRDISECVGEYWKALAREFTDRTFSWTVDYIPKNPQMLHGRRFPLIGDLLSARRFMPQRAWEGAPELADGELERSRTVGTVWAAIWNLREAEDRQRFLGLMVDADTEAPGFPAWLEGLLGDIRACPVNQSMGRKKVIPGPLMMPRREPAKPLSDMAIPF